MWPVFLQGCLHRVPSSKVLQEKFTDNRGVRTWGSGS